MNIVFLVGRLTKEPELRSTASGVSSVTFDLAVRQKYKNKDGEYGTDFFRCTVFRRGAEYIASYGKKGDLLSAQGYLSTSSWEKDGERRYRTEVICESVQILVSKNTSSTASGSPSPQGEGLPELPEEFDAEDLPY